MRRGSPLVSPARVTLDNFDKSTREVPIKRITWHVTGGAIVERALQAFGLTSTSGRHRALDVKTEADKVAERCFLWYPTQNGVSTTYGIDWMGGYWQLLDERWRAWSAGIKEPLLSHYKKGWLHWRQLEQGAATSVPRPTRTPRGFVKTLHPERYDFWAREYRERKGLAPDAPMPATASPLEFFDGFRSPDHTSISIDFLSPPYMNEDSRGIRCRGPKHELYEDGNLSITTAQYEAARVLANDIASAHEGFQNDREHNFSHSFTNPITRSWCIPQKKGGYVGYGWDPGELQWERIFA